MGALPDPTATLPPPGTSRAVDQGVKLVRHGPEVEVLHRLPHGALPDLLQCRDDGAQVGATDLPCPLFCAAGWALNCRLTWIWFRFTYLPHYIL